MSIKCRAGCDLYYSTPRSEREHFDVEHRQITFECKKCSEIFGRASRFYDHRKLLLSSCKTAQYQRLYPDQVKNNVVVQEQQVKDSIQSELGQFLSFNKPEASGIYRK